MDFDSKRVYNSRFRMLSNSFTESINSRIRTYLVVSKGVTNFQKFRKRIVYNKKKD